MNFNLSGATPIRGTEHLLEPSRQATAPAISSRMSYSTHLDSEIDQPGRMLKNVRPVSLSHKKQKTILFVSSRLFWLRFVCESF